MQEIADSLKVLADPARLQILRELMGDQKEKSVSVCNLAKRLNISQPNVSHHLKTLKTAGFITCQKDQRFSYYSVETTKIKDLFKQINAEISLP